MRVSSGDFIRKFGTYTDSALTEPIIITKNGRERLVLLSIDEYNTLLHLRELYEDSKEAAPRHAPDAEGARREPAAGGRKGQRR